MPSVAPKKAERMAVPTLPCRTAARAPRAAGNIASPTKNAAAWPDRTAMPVTGSTPDAIAGRARRFPEACPAAVMTPSPIPRHGDPPAGFGDAAGAGMARSAAPGRSRASA